jgi:ribosomal protein L30E
MSKCFTCGQNMPQTTKQRIEQYKKLAEVTGKKLCVF